MNKVFLIGRLSRDPELRHTTSGMPVCQINVAISRPVSQGREPETDFINVVVWNKQAENVARYLSKGRQIAVEGRIQTRNYDNNEGKGRLTDFKCGDKTLKEVLLEQLKKQLEAEFPDNVPQKKQTSLQKDIDQQDIFCYLNSEGFIPRPTYTKYLEDYVENSHDNKICLVTAEAGFGKTMLLANFATDFEEKNNGVKLYKRFCGASDLSSQTYSLWKSIIDEAGIDENEECYPNNIDELKRKPLLLKFISKTFQKIWFAIIIF